MDTQFATSPDGTQIAYSHSGSGPALILVHGGGTDRREWYESGYVGRLEGEFTVITLDLRGHGQSGQPTDPADYTTDKYSEDILAVADACGVEGFSIWAMSFGGKVARYLATQSERVNKFVLMSTPLGPGVSGGMRQFTLDFVDHWTPIHQEQLAGTLEPASLSTDDQEFLERFNLPVMLAWVNAMLKWPSVEPGDFLCPTLWMVGSQDENATVTLEQYQDAIPGSKLQVHLLEAMDHNQVFEEVDRVFPVMVGFTRTIVEPAA